MKNTQELMIGLVWISCLALLISLISVGLFFFKDDLSLHEKAATVNVKEVIHFISSEISQQNLSAEDQKKAIDQGVARLHQEIEAMAQLNQRAVFQKGAILGNVPDMTDELKDRLKRILK